MDVHWFKTTLSFLFGVTTPLGWASGCFLWHKRISAGDEGVCDFCLIFIRCS
jgi:hypothetical protein